jgi:hypothetical protein
MHFSTLLRVSAWHQRKMTNISTSFQPISFYQGLIEPSSRGLQTMKNPAISMLPFTVKTSNQLSMTRYDTTVFSTLYHSFSLCFLTSVPPTKTYQL